jgi:beta-lactam-binding protein with PASTA domain
MKRSVAIPVLAGGGALLLTFGYLWWKGRSATKAASATTSASASSSALAQDYAGQLSVIQTELEEVLGQTGSSASTGTSTKTSTTTGTSTIAVPNVVGRKDLNTAEGIIKAAGLTVASAGDTGAGNTGSVTSQSPQAGTKVAKGSKVTLTYTSNSADNGQVTVPNEIGRTDLDTAEAAIRNAGLTVRVTGNTAKAKGNKGKVTAQSPKAGAKVKKGSAVTITYS